MATRGRTLTTNRLRLRPPEDADFEAMHARLGVPEVTWDGTPMTREASKEKIRRRVEHFERHGFGIWVVEWRASGQFLGECGLQYLEGDETEVEIGYYLGTTAWGMGVATEAASAAIAYGWDELRLKRIVAVVRPQNAVSKRVLAKLGLRHAATEAHYGIDVTERWVIERPD